MSINNINIFRIVALTIIVLILVALVIVNIINVVRLNNHVQDKEGIKMVVKKTVAMFLICAIIILAIFSPTSQTFAFKISDDIKNVVERISVDNIDLELFENSPYEEINLIDRRLLLREDDNNTVFCIVQPQGTYLNQYGESNRLKKDFYSKNMKNEYGEIIITSVHIDKIYGIFADTFYGNIIIPISSKYELILDYKCDSDMNDCYTFIRSVLESICIV